ncbi:MAG: PEGA domain-containing protein [Bacteroidaceae bacterium]|nr:PEGA domain-containing protein [Bacteroidaceae bacterium]
MSVRAHRIVMVLALLAAVQSIYAQRTSIKVTSFEPNEMDQSHNTSRQKSDNNGDLTALVIVHTKVSGFTFSAGSAFCETDGPELENDETLYFVHVSKGTKKMTIKNDKYGKPLDFDFTNRLKLMTYDMYITTGDVVVISNDYVEKQWVTIDVTPAGALPYAMLEISEKNVNEDPNQTTMRTRPLDSGHFQEQMEVGTYWIKVTAGEEYGEYNGRLVVKGNETNNVPIKLVPHYGWLKLDGASAADNVTIYIDRKVQQNKSGSIQLASGQHDITIVRPLYKEWKAKINISDGETLTYNPPLEANFAETTFTVTDDPEAEIYIDGHFEGKGTCKRPLEPGSYTIEARKENHKERSRVVTITTREATTINLEAPVPLMGSLNITSSPAGATIKIDGKDYGKTPWTVNTILIGKHVVQFSHPNCKTVAHEVTVRQGEQTDLNVNLSSIGSFTFDTNTGYGILYIDGKYMGSIPYTWEATSGTYDIEVSSYGYKKFHKKNYVLNINKPNVMIKLRRQLINKGEFYIDLGGSVGAQKGIAANMGFYAGNFNMEANVKYLPSQKSEEIKWIGNSLDDKSFQYNPMLVAGGRIGWGIICGTRFRITPQVGAYAIMLKETNLTEGSTSAVVEKGSCATVTAGIRFMLGITRHIGLAVVPEYMFHAASSPGYKLLREVSPTIKGWSEGFNTNMYLTFYF